MQLCILNEAEEKKRLTTQKQMHWDKTYSHRELRVMLGKDRLVRGFFQTMTGLLNNHFLW